MLKFRVRDRVTHIDYPDQLGTVIAKYRQGQIGHIYLVKWDQPGTCSRHIGHALVLKDQRLRA